MWFFFRLAFISKRVVVVVVDVVVVVFFRSVLLKKKRTRKTKKKEKKIGPAAVGSVTWAGAANETRRNGAVPGPFTEGVGVQTWISSSLPQLFHQLNPFRPDRDGSTPPPSLDLIGSRCFVSK